MAITLRAVLEKLNGNQSKNMAMTIRGEQTIKYILLFPKREFVLSDSQPMMGSMTASKTRAIIIIKPAQKASTLRKAK